MFEVINDLGKCDVTGDFLCSVLIEVATENYRQLMQESMMLGAEELLDPPLRANERVMSGLFANAISKVSARSRPEARVDRAAEFDDYIDAGDGEEKNRTAGRVDFLAWYGNKTIAVELKVAEINWSKPQITARIKRRWKRVREQSNTAKEALGERSKSRYPNPESIGLMVLVTRSSKNAEKLSKEEVGDAKKLVMAVIENDTDINPEFIATYTFPAEFRDFIKKSKGKENADKKRSSTPFVIFLAYRAE